MITEPGGYSDMPMEEYCADPVVTPSLSRGTIRTLVSDCPARAYYEHPRLGGKPEACANGAMDMGSLCHSLLLEGIDKAFPIDPKDYPAKNGNIPLGWTNPAIREARDKARVENKIPMLIEDYERAKSIVDVAQLQLAMSELAINDLREEGDSELTYIWEEVGTWFRIRPDWISADRKIILDCKFTGQSASPEAFDRLVPPMGYDIQHSLYRRGVHAIDGTDPVFVFFVVETSPPFLACLFGLSPQYAAMGDQKVELGIGLWRKHLAETYWPGYDKRIHHLEPKPYVLASWEEKKFAMQSAEQGNDPTENW